MRFRVTTPLGTVLAVSELLTVAIPTRDPEPGRWRAVLEGLASQTLGDAAWELCVVDNGSATPPSLDALPSRIGRRMFREEKPGLLWARLAAMKNTRAPLLLFLDDDTVPDPDALEAAARFMTAHPTVGAAGGRIVPRYESPPPEWISEVEWALALRDFGKEELTWRRSQGGVFPVWTPIGAGLMLRREALDSYYRHVETYGERIQEVSWTGKGTGGNEDKDLVLLLLSNGWAVGYAPEFRLTHLISAERLRLEYFERLVPALGRMWMRTSYAHGFEAFSPVSPASLRLRQAKAWWVCRAWRGPRERLRWLNTCGHLAGLAAVRARPVRYPKELPLFGSASSLGGSERA